MTMLDFSEMQIAGHLALIDSALLAAVKPEELMGQAWNKSAGGPAVRADAVAGNKEQTAPNLLRCIRWFNRLSRWVSSEIVNGQTVKAEIPRRCRP